ncbi:hypothetical protein TKK_0014581 [Trichogramma kaykai]
MKYSVEKVEEIDENEHMYALETLSIESEPDDHNFDEKCDSYEEWSEDEEEEDLRNEFLPFTEKSTIVKKFTQAELNDLVRDLGLPKDGAEYLASTLKRRNMLESGTNASYYRTRNESFKQYFEEKKFDDEKLVHCNNVEDLMKEIKCNIYKTDEWRLFIDSSKRSLKAVLLHNTNKFASIPIAHSTTTKETYGTELPGRIPATFLSGLLSSVLDRTIGLEFPNQLFAEFLNSIFSFYNLTESPSFSSQKSC